jgi:hypothetical protein
LAGLLACLPFTEIHAEDACVPMLVSELFFSDGDVLPGVYLNSQMIGDLPKHVAENPRIKSFLSLNKNSTFIPLIIIGGKAPSSNYSLQMMPQENGVSQIVWVQRSSSDIGLMVLGHPMWLGLSQPRCADFLMAVEY